MRTITVNKRQVNSNFTGYYYPIYSLVIVRENNKNVVGRIIGYVGPLGVLVQSQTGKRHKLTYSEVVYYEEPHKPVMTLKEIERMAYKCVDKYSKEAVTINDKDYIITHDVKVVFDSEYGSPGRATALGSVCLRRTNPAHYEFMLSMPFLQYASRKQVKEVILHETAHIIAGEGIDGGNDHGPTWKAIYLAMGGNGKATVDIEDAAYLGMYLLGVPHKWSEPEHFEIPREKWTKLVHFVNREINLGELCQELDVGDRLLSDNGYIGSTIKKKVDKLHYSVISYSLVDEEKIARSMVSWTFNLFFKLIFELFTKLMDMNDRKYSKELQLVDKLFGMLTTDFKELVRPK